METTYQAPTLTASMRRNTTSGESPDTSDPWEQRRPSDSGVGLVSVDMDRHWHDQHAPSLRSSIRHTELVDANTEKLSILQMWIRSIHPFMKTFIACSIVNGVVFLDLFSFLPVVSPYILTGNGSGWVYVVSFVAYAICQILVSLAIFVTDTVWIGVHRVAFPVCMLLIAMGNMLYSYNTTSTATVFCGRALVGVGAGILSSSLALIQHCASAREVPAVLGGYEGAGFVGMIFGPLIALSLLLADNHIGPIRLNVYSLPPILVALLAFGAGCVVSFLVQNPGDAAFQNDEDEDEDGVAGASVSSSPALTPGRMVEPETESEKLLQAWEGGHGRNRGEGKGTFPPSRPWRLRSAIMGRNVRDTAPAQASMASIFVRNFSLWLSEGATAPIIRLRLVVGCMVLLSILSNVLFFAGLLSLSLIMGVGSYATLLWSLVIFGLVAGLTASLSRWFLAWKYVAPAVAILGFLLWSLCFLGGSGAFLGYHYDRHLVSDPVWFIGAVLLLMAGAVGAGLVTPAVSGSLPLTREKQWPISQLALLSPAWGSALLLAALIVTIPAFLLSQDPDLANAGILVVAAVMVLLTCLAVMGTVVAMVLWLAMYASHGVVERAERQRAAMVRGSRTGGPMQLEQFRENCELNT
jgi:MFS family permease